MQTPLHITQINLQPHFGGGEVYTAFLCRALDELGVATRLLVSPEARFWGDLPLPPSTRVEPVAPQRLAQALGSDDRWLLGHGPLPQAARTDGERLRSAIAHMPVQGRDPAQFTDHDMIFPVSGWVRDGLLAARLPAWNAPLYGIADLHPETAPAPIRRTSRYDWDRRKFRDRLLRRLEPLVAPLLPHPQFVPRPGITLGIVSRITPIKQFPLLFAHLAPRLAQYPEIHLEIFGSGGYASIRDLNRALHPIRRQVRFWGHQREVASVYGRLDYLLSGLPEKEALGLNLIEAQSLGTPVLAVAAPPFTETVTEGRTGFLYRDPRQDGGADFERLLRQIATLEQPLHPEREGELLRRFSFTAFTERLEPVVRWAAERVAT